MLDLKIKTIQRNIIIGQVNCTNMREKIIQTMYFSHVAFSLLSLVLNLQQILSGNINILGDDVLHRRLEDYLKYCPYTTTCDTNTTQLYFDQVPCCMNCKCDTECGLNCCPERSVRLESEEDMYNAKELIQCVDAQNRLYDNNSINGQSFEMVSKCPFSYSDNDIATRCAREYSDVIFNVPLKYILPAYDKVTDLIYKNVFCAKCHNVSESTLQFASTSFRCLTKVPNITYIRDLTPNSNFDDDCNILFMVPETKQAINWTSKICDRKFISHCNVTGLWDMYDRYLEEACLTYSSVYHNFRNVHCFLCNGFNESEIEKICEMSSIDYTYSDWGNSDSFSFIAVLDWTADRKLPPRGNTKQEMTEKDGYCVIPSGLLDLSKVERWLLHCPGGMVLQSGKCFLPFQDEKTYTVIEINLLLQPKDILTKRNRYSLNQMLSFIIDKLEDKMTFLVSQDIKIYDVEGYVTFKKKVSRPKTVFHLRSIKHVAVKIQILVNKLGREYFGTLLDFALVFANFTDMGDFFATFRHFNGDNSDAKSQLEWDTCTTDTSRQNYLFCPPLYLSNGELHFYVFNNESGKLLNITYIAISLEPEPFCSRIAFPKQHICNMSEQMEAVYSDAFLRRKLSENETHMFFCRQDYIDHLKSLRLNIYKVNRKTLPSANGRTMIFLSIFCLGASLLSLVLTLVVYSVYPVLRSLPGLNNMALVTSLILFQTMILLNSLTTININWLCAFVGAFTHFSLILSFAWMFICTFHMLNVFVKIRNRSVGRNDSRTFISYTAFAISVAVLSVSVTITVALIQSGGKDHGYGGSVCYITNPLMVIVFVAIPVAIVTILNIVMFCVVACKINKLPVLASTNPQERNNITIFVKLSTITGMTWIFGFIYIFTKLVTFAYIYIVLNAGQGVFIMLSFVCNRRVLHLIFRRQMARKSTQKTTGTRL